MNVSEIKRGRRNHTARELGERFGLTDRTIRSYFAEERADYESRAANRREQIIALHRQGLGVRATARQLGVDPGLVSKRLREAREAGVDLSRIEPDPGARDDG